MRPSRREGRGASRLFSEHCRYEVARREDIGGPGERCDRAQRGVGGTGSVDEAHRVPRTTEVTTDVGRERHRLAHLRHRR